MLTEAAPAKVNLFLRVIGRRADGYHELDSLAVFAGVADELRAEAAEALSLTLAGPFGAALEAEPDNLVLRAARALAAAAGREARVRLTLEKNLPVASGIGGGSADAAAILREEVRDLAALGCTYVQVDAPELALMVDDAVREQFRARGIDPERMLAEGVEIIDSVARDAPPGVRFGLHLCRGNRDGHWMAAGGYERISRAVFQRTRGFDTLFLEYDDERSGGFEPLRAVPEDRTVVLGLVSTKRPALEDTDELLARIDAAARFFARDQLALSPQCGFSSTIGGNPLTVEQEEAKLALVADVARRAWPS